MLEYDRIDISEGIDINKTNLPKECDIFHYWYFKNSILKVLIMLLLYMLREMLTQFIFGIWAKMMPLT